MDAPRVACGSGARSADYLAVSRKKKFQFPAIGARLPGKLLLERPATTGRSTHDDARVFSRAVHLMDRSIVLARAVHAQRSERRYVIR